MLPERNRSQLNNDVRRDLERYVALLAEWQRVHNLVGERTLGEAWTRHVADSLQLLDRAPADWHEWVDLGSGAGFPGLVVAIAVKGSPGHRVTLVESSEKKAAFLRAAIRETGAPAAVAGERIEAHAQRMRGGADVISARALAPLETLLELALPYAHPGTSMLFLKGQDYVQEVEAACRSFDFDVVDWRSTTDSDGRVLVIRDVRKKDRDR